MKDRSSREINMPTVYMSARSAQEDDFFFFSWGEYPGEDPQGLARCKCLIEAVHARLLILMLLCGWQRLTFFHAVVFVFCLSGHWPVFVLVEPNPSSRASASCGLAHAGSVSLGSAALRRRVSEVDCAVG